MAGVGGAVAWAIVGVVFSGEDTHTRVVCMSLQSVNFTLARMRGHIVVINRCFPSSNRITASTCTVLVVGLNKQPGKKTGYKYGFREGLG